MNNELIERIDKALTKAFNLGQTYWRQADSESYKQNSLSDGTLAKFLALREDCKAALSQREAEPVGYLYRFNPDAGLPGLRPQIYLDRQTVTNKRWSEHELYEHPTKPAPLPQPVASVPHGLQITGREGGWGLDRPMLFASKDAGASVPQDAAGLKSLVYAVLGRHGDICGELTADINAQIDSWMAGHVRAKIPAAMQMEPFQTIDRGSKNFKAGWNACRTEIIAASQQEGV